MRLSLRQYANILLALEKEVEPSNAQEMGKSFLKWLSRRGEKKLLPRIMREAEKISRERSGEVAVSIVTREKKDKAEEEQLWSFASKLFPQKKIIARFETDAKNIGGVMIQSEEILFDASLSRNMKELKRTLVR
ncbi:MAG: F0F1 ATP synthase subunit delta [Candidatus Moranbacteria bacterium]|nr:F0F1 ATP synthase subunit delta [Candidatus Moranbacteria bacterium]